MPTNEERCIQRDCGCQMYYTEDAEVYDTRVVWCDDHERLAVVLRTILEEFDVALAAQGEGT